MNSWCAAAAPSLLYVARPLPRPPPPPLVAVTTSPYNNKGVSCWSPCTLAPAPAHLDPHPTPRGRSSSLLPWGNARVVDEAQLCRGRRQAITRLVNYLERSFRPPSSLDMGDLHPRQTVNLSLGLWNREMDASMCLRARPLAWARQQKHQGFPYNRVPVTVRLAAEKLVRWPQVLGSDLRRSADPIRGAGLK